MRIVSIIQVSQDGRNWTDTAYEPPVPTAFICEWAYYRLVLKIVREPGDPELIELLLPPPTHPPTPPR